MQDIFSSGEKFFEPVFKVNRIAFYGDMSDCRAQRTRFENLRDVHLVKKVLSPFICITREITITFTRAHYWIIL